MADVERPPKGCESDVQMDSGDAFVKLHNIDFANAMVPFSSTSLFDAIRGNTLLTQPHNFENVNLPTI